MRMPITHRRTALGPRLIFAEQPIVRRRHRERAEIFASLRLIEMCTRVSKQTTRTFPPAGETDMQATKSSGGLRRFVGPAILVSLTILGVIVAAQIGAQQPPTSP